MAERTVDASGPTAVTLSHSRPSVSPKASQRSSAPLPRAWSPVQTAMRAVCKRSAGPLPPRIRPSAIRFFSDAAVTRSI